MFSNLPEQNPLDVEEQFPSPPPPFRNVLEGPVAGEGHGRGQAGEGQIQRGGVDLVGAEWQGHGGGQAGAPEAGDEGLHLREERNGGVVFSFGLFCFDFVILVSFVLFSFLSFFTFTFLLFTFTFFLLFTFYFYFFLFLYLFTF